MPATNWFKLFILSLVWGGSFIFIEIALADFPPFTLVFARMALAAAILFAIVFARKMPIPKNPRTWLTYAIMGILTNVAPFSLIAWGQQHITAATASILNATVPLFVVFAAWKFGAESKPRPAQIIGVLIGFAGVLILMSRGIREGISSERLGEFAVLGAAASYAAGSIYAKRFHDTPALVNAAAMCSCSALILAALCLIIENPLTLQPGLKASLAVVAIAVLSTAFAFLLYFNVLRSAGPTFLSLVTYLIPIVAISFGVLLLNEPLPATSIAGVATIFLGLLILDGRAAKCTHSLFQSKNDPPT
ncbi:MAG: DMT family transporter [Verrucomicrobiota bacterium]